MKLIYLGVVELKIGTELLMVYLDYDHLKDLKVRIVVIEIFGKYDKNHPFLCTYRNYC